MLKGSIQYHTRAREAEMCSSIEAHRQYRSSTIQQWHRQRLGCHGRPLVAGLFLAHLTEIHRQHPRTAIPKPQPTIPKPSMGDQVAEHRKQMTHNPPNARAQQTYTDATMWTPPAMMISLIAWGAKLHRHACTHSRIIMQKRSPTEFQSAPFQNFYKQDGHFI